MSKQKLSDLAKKKGIYGALLLGIFVIVAVVMIVLTNNAGKTEDKNPIDLNEPPYLSSNDQTNPDSTYADQETVTPKQNNEVAEITSEPAITETEKTEQTKKKEEVAEQPKKVKEETVAEKPTKEAQQQTAEQPVEKIKPVMQTTAKNLKFSKEDGLSWPVKGNVILPYCVDETTYYATLKQYMTNPAILISSEVGTKVKASAKGVVTEIAKDVRTGNTVTMDIGNGFQLVYGQLADSLKCKVGDTVEAGQIIGTVDKETKYFVVEGPHLYFKVLEGEKTIDPMTLLKSE